jgi:hypothetical protein
MIRNADQCVRHRTDIAARECLNTLRVFVPRRVGNQEECKMYIGGGIGLVLLIVIIVMLVR